MDPSYNTSGRDQRFEQLARGGPDLILITDADGRVQRAWGSTERLLGVNTDALPGRLLRDLIEPSHRPGFDEYFEACRKEPNTRRYVDVRPAATGEVWCEFETFNNRHDDPTHLQLAFRVRDVTSRYATRDLRAEEAARQQLAEQLNEALTAILAQTAAINRQLSHGNVDVEWARGAVADIERIVARAANHLGNQVT